MAEEKLSSLLSRLEGRAARLNAASDSLNDVLSTVEKRLVDANVGVEVWLRKGVAGTDSKGSPGQETCVIDRLGFAKVDGEWSLAVKKVEIVTGFFEGDTNCPYTNEYAVGDPMPLRKANREIRIAALERLPELLQRLAEEADRCVDAIHHAQELTNQS